MKQFKPSASGTTTLFDDFAGLRAVIRNDGVLSERQASAFVADLNAQIVAARTAIAATDPAVFTRIIADVRTSVANGEMPRGAAGAAFLGEILGHSGSRPRFGKVQLVNPDKILSSMQFMPRTLRELGVVRRSSGIRYAGRGGLAGTLKVKGMRAGRGTV